MTWLERSVCATAFIVFVSIAALAQRPNEVVTWKGSLPVPAALRPGAKVTAKLEAKIQAGWHVYSISQPPGGPTPTVISVPEGQPFRLAGPVAGPVPHSVYDPNFQMQTEYYVDSATFRVPLRVAAGAASGPGKAMIDVIFQTCNDRICLPPATVHVPLSYRVLAPAGR